MGREGSGQLSIRLLSHCTGHCIQSEDIHSECPHYMYNEDALQRENDLISVVWYVAFSNTRLMIKCEISNGINCYDVIGE